MKWERLENVGARTGVEHAGRSATVNKSISGWQASVRYPEGKTIESKYYTSESSAKKWAEKEINRGSGSDHAWWK